MGRVNKGRPWQRPRSANKSRPNPQATAETPSGSSSACSRCGRRPARDRQHCPARDATCRKCSKKGHYQAVCRSASVRQVDTRIDASDAFLGALGETADSTWSVMIDVNETPMTLHIDTGAEATVISEEAWRKLGQPTLSAPGCTLRGPDTHRLPTTGQFAAKLSKEGHTAEEEIYVAKKLHHPLIGRPAIHKLGLVSRISSVDQASQTPAVQFPKLFEGLGKLQGDYRIQLQEGAKPYALSALRQVPIPLMKSVEQELRRMEDLGVIAKVHEPTEWCAGMVVVPKANSKVRICVDLTNLNKSVLQERHPLPAVDQTLAQLAGATVFSKLDANSDFGKFHSPLSRQSSPLSSPQ